MFAPVQHPTCAFYAKEDIGKIVSDLCDKESNIISDYTATCPQVKQLIDLALLGNGLLKGQQLSDFINRSIQLM